MHALYTLTHSVMILQLYQPMIALIGLVLYHIRRAIYPTSVVVVHVASTMGWVSAMAGLLWTLTPSFILLALAVVCGWCLFPSFWDKVC